MIPREVLTQHLVETLVDLNRNGDLTWGRASDWTSAGNLPSNGTRGGGMAEGAEDDDRHDDRQEDAAAARYHDELDTLTKRIDADCARLRRIIGICAPTPPKQLHNRDLLVAQVAADGWCISCWRDDQHLTPIALRPSGQPYYRDRCRACGEWKAEHGQDPPKLILELRHAGRRITTADVERALGRSA